MKSLKTFPFALLALATLVAAVPQSPVQGATLLRRSFKADSIDTYKVEEKVQETVKSPLGEMPVNVASFKTYVVKTLKVDAAAGTAQIEATTTTDKRTADGPVSTMLGDKPAPVVQTGKVDMRGRMTLDKALAGDAMSSLLSGSAGPDFASLFVELPEKAVKIGDAWDVTVPKSPLLNGDQDQKLQAKLEGEKEIDGTPVWVVSLKGHLQILVDTAKMPASKTLTSAMRVTGGIDLTGEGLLDKATGRTISMTTKGVSKTSIELVEQGLSIDAQGTVDSTSKLQKPLG